MSALGQNRTSAGYLGHVRFTPESGHWPAGLGMSALCQKRTYAAQQIAPLFDRLVGEGKQFGRHAVLYLRVSTVNQTTANQERELRRLRST